MILSYEWNPYIKKDNNYLETEPRSWVSVGIYLFASAGILHIL